MWFYKKAREEKTNSSQSHFFLGDGDGDGVGPTPERLELPIESIALYTAQERYAPMSSSTGPATVKARPSTKYQGLGDLSLNPEPWVVSPLFCCGNLQKMVLHNLCVFPRNRLPSFG